ncbi:sensor histidine kinase [Paenibacillus xerothermodurans]|uniref:histidine kinase n=1 Tax=Paenibacillus xerothermodurans TaxID=1977292 RepID=A0A2W1NSP7_PAEXE|nr:HAMP domain-containing sensor histidine kinase [Paenibacillus xerothermodurans]PZE21803.1 sensor histidine kinase [Paenibacillus xerothermodurans]
MLFVLIGLWTIGLLLLITDPKRSTTRWIASIAFTGGAGALSAVIHDHFTPYLLERQLLNDTVMIALGAAESASSLVCYYGLPYTFLMFCVIYHPQAAQWRWKRALTWILLVPAGLSFAFEPEAGRPIPYHFVTYWTVPYILLGIGLLLHAAFKERNSFLRKHRMLTTLAAAPTLFFAVFTLYVLPTFFGLYESWRYNALVIGFTLAVILFSSFRYGFMGLQISIHNQKLDYTLRAITSGTAILNHAIKNDVGKIRLFSEKIKSEAGRNDPAQLIDDIDVIMNASQHIYDMIYRIQGQTQEIDIRPEPLELGPLLERCITMLEPALADISVVKEFHSEGRMSGDRAQLVEVLTNVMTNAIEAMPHGGTLTVKLTETKRNLVVEIKDTGSGMDKKQQKRVFDPFYTTKSGKKLNFGLGLSYCYAIVQKHKGSMELHSQPGHGTSVFINFLKRKGGAAI